MSVCVCVCVSVSVSEYIMVPVFVDAANERVCLHYCALLLSRGTMEIGKGQNTFHINNDGSRHWPARHSIQMFDVSIG